MTHAPPALPTNAPVRLSRLDLGLWLLGALAFSWPALWNGFPLFFYDSVDYIRGSFTFEPAIYRTLPYSVFLTLAHGGVSLWAAIAAQSLIVSYLVLESCHAFAPAAPRRTFLIAAPIVALGTGLPWFVSQIMPDVFTGPMVMGLALLGLARLPTGRRILVVLLTLVAISAHASHFGTALAVVLGLVLLAWAARGRFRSGVLLPLTVAVAGILLTPAIHKVATGEFFVSRSAPIMALARLIRDGEAQRYLAETCPEKAWRLCPYLDQLKPGWNGANDFLWPLDSPFHLIGGWGEWQENGAEARAIVMGTVIAHPLSNLGAALHDWIQQLATFGTGSGLGEDVWSVAPLESSVAAYFPGDSDALSQARQRLTYLDLKQLSAGHQGVLAAATLAALLLLFRYRREIDPGWAFVFLVLAATLSNSAVTAIFSNPDDRYQARLIWLLVPAVLCLLGERRWTRAHVTQEKQAIAPSP